MKRIRDLLIIICISLLLLEVTLRIYFDDFLYYAENRFLFVEPYSFENKSDNFWAYRENTEFKVAAVYHFGKLGSHIEYRCTYKSNNLGLIQNSDFEPDSEAMLVMGDSFTEGHGGCPWFYELEKNLGDIRIVNGGLQGTGFHQWAALLDYLQERSVTPTAIVIIAISDDFFRPQYTWPQEYLDCLNLKGPCDARNVWGSLENITNNDFLISAAEERYQQHFSERKDRSAFSHWLRHNIYITKFSELIWHNFTGKSPRRTEHELPDYTMKSILTIRESVNGNFKLILVPMRDEIALRALNNRSLVARKALSSAGLDWSECQLAQGDYMTFDGHPNASGYQKISDCARNAILSLHENSQ